MEQENLSSFTKKDIWLWALYDFANSIAFVAVVFYFGLWFIAELGGSDSWISIAVALSTVLLLVTLPFLGHLSDRLHRRMPFLTVLSLLAVVSLLILGIVGGKVEALSGILSFVVIVLYFLFQYFYQASLAFYNAFLQDLSKAGVSAEKISGLGIGMGQLGNLVGLAVMMPFALGKISLFGLSGRPAAFAVGAILFFVCYLPVALWLKDKKAASYVSESTNIGGTLRDTWRDLRKIRQYPGVLPYLITYYLVADAVLTLAIFVTVYLEVVGGLDDTQKNIVMFAGVLLGILGAIVSPFFVRLFKSKKRAVGFFIALWMFSLLLFTAAKGLVMFSVIAALNGFVYSALFSLSRAFYSTLVPPDKQAELFSIYVLFERAASILGPLVWSGTALLFASYGPVKYRFAVLSLALLVGISLITFRFVPESIEKTVSMER